MRKDDESGVNRQLGFVFLYMVSRRENFLWGFLLPRKLNGWNPENDGFQKESPFPKTSDFRFHVKFQGVYKGWQFWCWVTFLWDGEKRDLNSRVFSTWSPTIGDQKVTAWSNRGMGTELGMDGWLPGMSDIDGFDRRCCFPVPFGGWNKIVGGSIWCVIHEVILADFLETSSDNFKQSQH